MIDFVFEDVDLLSRKEIVAVETTVILQGGGEEPLRRVVSVDGPKTREGKCVLIFGLQDRIPRHEFRCRRGGLRNRGFGAP